MTSGWKFFGIPICNFGLDRKIPKYRRLDQNLKTREIPSGKSQKFQTPGDRDRDMETTKKSQVKNLRFGFFRKLGFFAIGIQSSEFRIFGSLGISLNFRIFSVRFTFGIGIFFPLGMDIPTKTQLRLNYMKISQLIE